MARPFVTKFANFRPSSEDKTSGSVGGPVERYTADSQSLLVGDAVYVSGVNKVDKATTAANYVRFVGFVVTGDALGDDSSAGVYPVGTTAAAAGQQVLVQTGGNARGIVGATGFTAGTDLAVPSAATAGRLIPGTTADQRLGVALTTQPTAGSEVIIHIKQF